MYSEIILRAAAQQPAPDFSSVHAAALRSAQKRSFSRHLAQMFNPKHFGSPRNPRNSTQASSPSLQAVMNCSPAAPAPEHAPSELVAARSTFVPVMSWADAVVPPEDAAAAAAAAAAAESAAIAAEAKSAADKQAAALGRIAAAARAAAEAQLAREAQAAALVLAAAEAQRVREEKLAAQAQASADAKAAAEAKAIARAEAAAEARAAAQAILLARSNAAAQARAADAARTILNVILRSAELKISALERSKAHARPSLAAAAAPAVSEQRHDPLDLSATPALSPAQPVAPPSASDFDAYAEALQIELENAVAEMMAAEESAFTALDADDSYFEKCLLSSDLPQEEHDAEADTPGPELQAVIDEITRFL